MRRYQLFLSFKARVSVMCGVAAGQVAAGHEFEDGIQLSSKSGMEAIQCIPDFKTTVSKGYQVSYQTNFLVTQDTG